MVAEAEAAASEPCFFFINLKSKKGGLTPYIYPHVLLEASQDVTAIILAIAMVCFAKLVYTFLIFNISKSCTQLSNALLLSYSIIAVLGFYLKMFFLCLLYLFALINNLCFFSRMYMRISFLIDRQYSGIINNQNSVFKRKFSQTAKFFFFYSK